MEVRSPEAGMTIDKDLVLVMKIHEVLVGEMGAKPLALKFLIDAQRVFGVDGHYEAEYELKEGGSLIYMCKQIKKDMIFRVSFGKGQMNYAVELDKFVGDDLIVKSIFDVKELVEQWMRA